MNYTCLPSFIASLGKRFSSHFLCPVGRHSLIMKWLLVALILDNGRGNLKELCRLIPVKYWSLLRFIKTGWWDQDLLLSDMAEATLRSLPPPADGVLYLAADTTIKGKRGKNLPLCSLKRMNDLSSYTFGFEMILLLACWGKYRIPVDQALLDPAQKGERNELMRQMIQRFRKPAWAKKVVVVADAAFSARETFRLIEQKQYYYVFAVSRTWKLEDGCHLRDLVRNLPRSRYRRVASYKPDGRRRDYWVFRRPGKLRHLGDVTMVLSRQRRNDGPKRTKILVTNLREEQTGRILSIYARRWAIETTFKELKGGLHLGRMQVTGEADRVRKAAAVSVMAYLLLIRLYGKDGDQDLSIFKLKERFREEYTQEQILKARLRWKKRLDIIAKSA